jgi:hypothetical protein
MKNFKDFSEYQIFNFDNNDMYIHIYLEISQGNCLCSYLYLKEVKTSFFFFFLQQNRRTGEGEQVLWRERGGVGISGREEVVGKGCKRVNMIQIL